MRVSLKPPATGALTRVLPLSVSRVVLARAIKREILALRVRAESPPGAKGNLTEGRSEEGSRPR